MIMLLVLLITGLGFYAYGSLPETFFLQDEWAIFGNYLYWQKANLSWFTRLFIYEQETHLIPLSNFVSYLQFRLFGLAFPWYALMSIAIHGVNTILVYILARKLIGNMGVAVLSAMLFFVNSAAHQGVTWTATTIGTAGSTLFVLLSLIFLDRYVSSHKIFSRTLIVSFVLFVISLGFKETSIFLFLFIPIYVFLTKREKNKKRFIGFLFSIFVVGVLYLFSRIVISSFWIQTAATTEELAQPNAIVYGYRLLTNPIKIAVQSVVPQATIVYLAQIFVHLVYPHFVQGGTADPYLVTSAASDVVTFFVAVVFGALLFFVYPRAKSFILISLAFIAISSIPFFIIPGRAGYISLFDGRHLYMTSIFTSILIAVVYWQVNKSVSQRRYMRAGIAVLLLLYIGFNVRTIRRDIRAQVTVARQRVSILSTITSLYPTLPTKPVFYIESDKAYYGLPPEETIVPFQSGFGQTLLVWYNTRGENFPACFFERKFLYVLTAEDYKECEGRGFGYYRKRTTLNQALRTYVIDANEILAFRFTSSTNAFQDVTAEIRERIRRFGQL